MAITGIAGSPSLADLPQFLKAKTPQKLTEEMLSNNLRLKSYVNYFSIQFVGGYWYAWYVVDIEKR